MLWCPAVYTASVSRLSVRRTQSIARVLIMLLVVVGMAALWWNSSQAGLDLETVRSMVADAGAMGPLLFLLLFALLQPFGISAHIFILTAALAWSPAMAIILSWIGSLLAASVAFVTSRTLARDAIQARVPERLRRWDDALERNGLRTVILLRFLFFTTFLVQLMYGLTKVRYRDYLLGTALGNTPQIVIEVLCADWVLAWIG